MPSHYLHVGVIISKRKREHYFFESKALNLNYCIPFPNNSLNHKTTVRGKMSGRATATLNL